MRILAICEKINEELQQKQKIYVLIQLIDYLSQREEITENELDFLQTVANAFYVPEIEFANIKSFIIDHGDNLREKGRLLVISSLKPASDEIKHIRSENFKGEISFLQISSTNTLIMRYRGTEDLSLTDRISSQDKPTFLTVVRYCGEHI